jgi:hypothetical protein
LTKPASVPYLNLFCDPRIFQCNSGNTLDYVGGTRTFDEKMWVNEKGMKFDGPLFDLPGGQVKAAIGASYTGINFHFVRYDNSGAPNLAAAVASVDAQPYDVWASFVQLNVPIFGDNNAIPFFRRLEFEVSWRHDQYGGTLNGGTSNPKVGMTWMLSEDAGLSLKGSWGTSFRFANAGEYSPIASTVIGSFNLPTALQKANTTSYTVNCAGGVPTADSGAAKVFAELGPSSCGSTTVSVLVLAAHPPASCGPRLPPPFNLAPEVSTNWSGGFDLVADEVPAGPRSAGNLLPD